MGFVEQRVFRRIPFPTKYHRYIDDTFIVAETRAVLDSIRHAFGDSSVLNFTCEFPHEGTLPFLDVKVKQNTLLRKRTSSFQQISDGSVLQGMVLKQQEFPSEHRPQRRHRRPREVERTWEPIGAQEFPSQPFCKCKWAG